MKPLAVAVDGPAGSGKSTVAKLAAERLGIVYIDTGAMYRSVAYYCMAHGIDTKEEKKVEEALLDISLCVKLDGEKQRIILNGEDVSEKIRTSKVGQGSSDVAAYKKVRERLVALQRELAKKHSVIMDGRDIGTNVLPHAEIKIYLSASVEERAIRRQKEFFENGETPSLEEVKQMIKTRDKNDRERELNPLCQAKDAVLLDTTNLTIEEAVEKIVAMVRERAEE